MPTQEDLEQKAADVRAGITAQGGKVKSLKDDVKAKKKAKVRANYSLKGVQRAACCVCVW